MSYVIVCIGREEIGIILGKVIIFGVNVGVWIFFLFVLFLGCE